MKSRKRHEKQLYLDVCNTSGFVWPKDVDMVFGSGCFISKLSYAKEHAEGASL